MYLITDVAESLQHLFRVVDTLAYDAYVRFYEHVQEAVKVLVIFVKLVSLE